MNQGYFITGIGTDVGKTVAAAIFAEALSAAYWKPIQAGTEPATDAQRVDGWTSAAVTISPEARILAAPESPHSAADKEGVEIRVEDLALPAGRRPVITEGAGGWLVPVNHRETMADLALHLGLPVVVVSRHYLGSIHHTLSTIECIRRRGLEVAHLVYVGEHAETEQVVSEMTGIERFFRIPLTDRVDRDFVAAQAIRLRRWLEG